MRIDASRVLVFASGGKEGRREALDASKRVQSPSSSRLKGGREGRRLWTHDASRVPRLLVWRKGGKEGGSGRVLTRPESLVFSSGGKERRKEALDA